MPTSLLLFMAAGIAWYFGGKSIKPTEEPVDDADKAWRAITANPLRALAMFLFVGGIIYLVK